MKFILSTTFPKSKDSVPVRFTDEKESHVYLLPNLTKEIHIGVGKKGEMNKRKFISLIRQIGELAKSKKIKKVALNFSDLPYTEAKMAADEAAEVFSTNMVMADYEYNMHKTAPKGGWDSVQEVAVVDKTPARLKGPLTRGEVIGKYVNICRDISNAPANTMPPVKVVEQIKKFAKGTKVKVTVLGEKEMLKLGFGGVMAIGQGAKSESQFVVMEYMEGKKSEQPIVYCGKGVVFDSGGLNIKTGGYMNEMHMDKTGAASVIATMFLLNELKVKKNVVGITPLVENMPGGNSIRPGDIITTLSKKTVQVDNTDAEGRVILADALHYAKKYKPRFLMDIATLHGATMVALGLRASGIFTKDEKLGWKIKEMAEESGDYSWPMPMWEEYEPLVKAVYADITNSGKNRYGGAIEGAYFLYQFAQGDWPFVHLDIAPRMTSTEGDHLAKGSPGDPVRLLLKIVEEY